jgi:protocatechuate 3,4-dioxygenase beta subunit
MRRQLQRRVLMRGIVAGASMLAFGANTPALGSACVALPQETSGPFPADGSDRQFRRVTNVLSLAGIVRSDIRSSFAGSTTTAQGIPLQLDLRVLDVAKACEPLANCAVYLWHCNRDGEYSLYGRGVAQENYLRGVQFTDRTGSVRFQSIFPACYQGRFTHLHIEVFRSGGPTLRELKGILTTQLTVARDICASLYQQDRGYSASLANLQSVSAASDSVFADSSPLQLRSQTLSISANPSGGYLGSANIGLRG